MICIITVYKSNNFGSYLQAKTLREVLLKYDDCVVFLDGHFRPWFYKFQIKEIIRHLYHLNFKYSWYIVHKIYNNYKLWKQLPYISLNEAKKHHDITFILGSDEIWNLAREECRNPLFWGYGLSSKRIISFSPSLNNATIEQIKSEKYVQEALKRMTAISVRDAHSQDVISTILQHDITLTIDPTLFYDYDYYSKTAYTRLPYKYIALYVFSKSLLESDINNIKRFAKEHDLKIVSLAESLTWCDESICIKGDNPFLYYRDAEFVITNTFHGTVFAINFNTQFVSLSYTNNNKIVDLLASFNLTKRIVSGMYYEDFQRVLQHKIDYNTVEKHLTLLKDQSLYYIDKAISNR